MRIDKLPVLLGAIAGVPLAIWLAPRRVLTPLAALALLVGVFVAEGAAGASVIDRYLMGAATVLLLFCAVAIGGWSMLEPGSTLRRVWMVGAGVLVLYGGVSAATTLSLSSLRTTLAYHEEFHKGLAVALADPRVKRRAAALSAAVAAEQQADPRRALDPRHRRPARHRRAQPGAGRRRQALAHAGGSHPPRQRRGLPARQRGLRRGDRRRRRRPARSGPAERLQAHLHEPLLRRLCQLLRSPAAGPGRRSRLVLIAGLGLRLWGVRQGLPYAYNADEADHFVPRAVAMFGHDLNPHYFANPPAFTYVLHYPVRARLRRREGACGTRSRCTRPTSTRSRASPPPCSAPPRCGCSTRPARACSAAPSACSRRRSRPSRSCPSSTPTWRSTTCPRWRR